MLSRGSNPWRHQRTVSDVAWQSKRKAHSMGVMINMADSNKTQISTAQAAYSMTLADFETWLTVEYHAVDAKTGKPLYKQADGKTGTDVTDEPVMRLPSPPNAGANLPAEWQVALLDHPMVADKGRYDDGDLSKMTRYAVWLVMGEAAGHIKVPREYRQAFDSWAADYEAQQKATFAANRQGAIEANKTAREAVGKLTGMQARMAEALKSGILTQEQYDLMMAGDAS